MFEKEATKTFVVEHFEAYGQCRDSRRIADLENKLANVSYQLEGRELELKELKDKCSSLLDKLYLIGLTPKQIAIVEQLQDVLGV